MLNFIPLQPEPKNMKTRSLVALALAIFASGLAHAGEPVADAVVQRVVAAIKSDLASEFDCAADDDRHRFREPPAAVSVAPVPSSGMAAAARQDRLRMARLERQLRGSSTAR